MTRPPPRNARPHCYVCDKAQSMCVCRHLRPIANSVGVHVLQHPRESHHPLGTARLLRLGLASVQVHVLPLQGKQAASPAVDLPEGAGLLYPSADAQELTTLPPAERPAHLVVIDGTWAHANRIFRDNPWISALPRYRLKPLEISRYRIRTEPREECLSTVESVVAALRLLQPDLEGTEMLESAFEAMIDEQIAASERVSTHCRKKRVRQRASQAIPEAMRAAETRMVVFNVEAAPLRAGDTEPRKPIRLCAVSLDGRHVFDRMIETRHAPSAREAGFLGLVRDDFEPSEPFEAVMEAFRAFCEDAAQGGTLLQISWGGGAQRWLQGGLEMVPHVMLKGVWANLSQARVPGLGVLVESLGLAVPELPIKGRAGLRLSQAWAMTRHITSARFDAP